MLRVWLPMTKDLRNQGLSNVTVTNNGATFNSNGKLGGCYYFNGSSKMFLPSFSTTRSIAFWLKCPKTNSTIAFVDYKSKLGFGFQSNGYIIPNCGSSSDARKMYSAENFIANEWNHIALIRDDNFTDVVLYINGELQTNRLGNNQWDNSVDGCFIGGRNQGTCMTCSINDFRVYDHCLSPMEVKQLSQGLVLHYPLNRNGWGQENLHKNSDTITSTWSINQGTVSDGVVTITPTTSSDRRIYQMPANGGWTWQSGKTYTASIDAKSPNGAILIFFPYGAGSMSQSYTVTSDWKRYTFTFTATQSGTASMTYHVNQTSGVSLQLKHPKLEEGSVATPWCPNSSDTLATTMGLNSTTEYDCSGFCNNGTRTGTFTWTSDTPKYAVSTHIGATTQKIHISNFPTSGFGNSYSFAWWGKRNSNSPMFWGFSDGIRLNGMFNGVYWNTGDGNSNPIYKPNTTTTITAPSVNVWHHYVMTGDGTTCKLYVDGELYGQAKAYKAISGTSIYINGWDSSTSYCHTNANMSDFRIYATALSASDVLSLYQNSAYIDNSGNVYGAVHSEV